MSKSKRSASQSDNEEQGRFAYEGLSRILHERSRLSIMTGYLEVWKKQESIRSQTLFRVTPTGKKGFLAYLNELEKVVHDALPSKQSSVPSGALPGWQPGWTS